MTGLAHVDHHALAMAALVGLVTAVVVSLMLLVVRLVVSWRVLGVQRDEAREALAAFKAQHLAEHVDDPARPLDFAEFTARYPESPIASRARSEFVVVYHLEDDEGSA